jgi:hypothetical protein
VALLALFSLGVVGTIMTALRVWKVWRIAHTTHYGAAGIALWLVDSVHLNLLSYFEVTIMHICANTPALAGWSNKWRRARRRRRQTPCRRPHNLNDVADASHQLGAAKFRFLDTSDSAEAAAAAAAVAAMAPVQSDEVLLAASDTREEARGKLQDDDSSGGIA